MTKPGGGASIEDKKRGHNGKSEPNENKRHRDKYTHTERERDREKLLLFLALVVPESVSCIIDSGKWRYRDEILHALCSSLLVLLITTQLTFPGASGGSVEREYTTGLRWDGIYSLNKKQTAADNHT